MFYVSLDIASIHLPEQKSIGISKFVDLETRILSCNFLETSLFIIVTKSKGIILINTVNWLPFKKDTKISNMIYLNFSESAKFSYIGQEIKVPGFQVTQARRKFK